VEIFAQAGKYSPARITGVSHKCLPLISSLLSLSLFFLVGLGLELRASYLQSRHATAWATHPVHFPLVILELGGVVSQSNFLGWPRTEIFPISARITGVSHQRLASVLPPPHPIPCFMTLGKEMFIFGGTLVSFLD
jgi:hypothetical protein